MRYGFFDNPFGLIFSSGAETTVIDLRNLSVDQKNTTWFITLGSLASFADTVSILDSTDSVIQQWEPSQNSETGLILERFPIRGDVVLKIENATDLFGYYEFDDLTETKGAMKPLTPLSGPLYQMFPKVLTVGADQFVGTVNEGDMLTLSWSATGAGTVQFTFTPSDASISPATFPSAALAGPTTGFENVFTQIPLRTSGTITATVAVADVVVSGYVL